jgi:hypothetical protein
MPTSRISPGSRRSRIGYLDSRFRGFRGFIGFRGFLFSGFLGPPRFWVPWCTCAVSARQPDRIHWVFIAGVAAAAIATVLAPRIAQDPAYHQFADTRPLLGVPNSLNVLSNLPFALVGLAGLGVLSRLRTWERWPYAALFAGTALTSIGSAYYHLAPDNWRLVWDRLPMTVGFMGLLTAVIAERVSNRAARTLFVPLLVLGTASVGYWYWSEIRGAGDLRPYALVQFGSLLAIVIALLLDPRNRDDRYFFLGLGAYLLAKAFESADRPIYEAWNIVSGHTIKHLMAAVGLWFIVVLLRQRATTADRTN